MNRNLKAIVIAITAITAIGALTAHTALAASFHSSSATTRVTSTPDGTEKNSHVVFNAAGGLITCGGPQTSLTGTVTSATTFESLTIEANYGPKQNCLFFGQQTVVNVNGCDYILRSNKTVDIASKQGRNCATEPITFSVSSPECTVTIGPQSGLASVNYINNASKNEITLEASIAGIRYTSHGSGCIKTGFYEDGFYSTGNAWLTGSEDKEGGAMVSLWYE